MSNTIQTSGWMIAAAALAWTAGCGSSQPAPPAAKPAANSQTIQADIEAAFASLSAVDRALAKAQEVCPVSGHALGEMGLPPKVEVEGKTVFLCCESCREPFMADPAKYLAEMRDK
jgi:YHS domain-containing protein